VHSSRISRFNTLPQEVLLGIKKRVLKVYSGKNKTTKKELYRDEKIRNKGET
jgi:hypothetical protein